MGSDAVKFTYNSLEKQVEGKHSFNIEDGKASFAADFIITESTAADLATAVQTAMNNYSINNVAFLLKVGASTVITWDHAANTGFLTKPKCTKVGSPHDAGLSQKLRFELQLELPPSDTGRSGRREGQIQLLAPNPDYLRTMEFTGTYTALDSPLTTAKATFDANVSGWLASWVATITTTGSWVFHSHLKLDWDDENKVLTFHSRYQEFVPTSTPTEVTNGVYTIGRFIRTDPEVIGEPLLNTAVAGYAGGRGSVDPVGSPNAAPGQIGTRVPRRFTAKTKTFFANTTPKPDGYWAAIVRKWISASVQAIFGSGRVIYEKVNVTAIDVEEKAIEADISILIATNGMLIEYEEKVTKLNDSKRVIETVWSGVPDDFDIQEGGRQIRITQVCRQRRLDQAPTEPNLLGSPWVFLTESVVQFAEVIDPVTDKVLAVEYTHNRHYLYAPNAGSGGGSGAGGARSTSSFRR